MKRHIEHHRPETVKWVVMNTNTGRPLAWFDTQAEARAYIDREEQADAAAAVTSAAELEAAGQLQLGPEGDTGASGAELADAP